MKIFSFRTSLLLLGMCLLSVSLSAQNAEKQKLFSFAFFTDIHLSGGNELGFKGLKKAIAKAKELNVDFVVTGGDNANIDKLKDSYQSADSLVTSFSDIFAAAEMKVYPSMGNHDRYIADGAEGYTRLFEAHFGSSYYTFTHKGWRFIILNTVQREGERYPRVGEKQLAWLSGVTDNLGDEPVILVAHVPLLSTFYADAGKLVTSDIVSNGKEVSDMFSPQNLKLVLQGHKHVYDELLACDIQYVGAGALSGTGSWTSACRDGKERGFLLLDVFADGSVSWEYIISE